MSENGKRDIQHPNWCFTLNYGGADQLPRSSVDRFLEVLSSKATYLVVGFEVAPTTAQKHAQGYVQLSKRARLTELKAIPDGGTVHWEVARGDEVQNRDYCLKECGDDRLEVGEARTVNSGVREQKRWKEARECAVKNDFAKMDDQIYVMHYSSVKAIARDHLMVGADLDGTCGLWIYGPSGTGKSRTAREEFGPPTNIYLKPVNKWWDGYRDQPHVLLEDVEPSHSVLGYHFKIWADRYAFPAEVKGSTIAIRPKKIVITSQYHPRDIFTDPESLAAILRRFTLRYVGPQPNPWEGTLTTIQIQPPQSTAAIVEDGVNIPSQVATSSVIVTEGLSSKNTSNPLPSPPELSRQTASLQNAQD